MGEVLQTGHGRVFIQVGGAGPANVPEYLSYGRVGGLTESFGDVTAVRNPSRQSYDQFDEVDEVQGEEGRPTSSLITRFTPDNSIIREKCPFDAQVHYGMCGDPEDFNGGWSKILAFERCKKTGSSTDDLSALDASERAAITFTIDFSLRKVWHVDPVALGEVGASYATREIVAIVVRDYLSCGDCGYTSDGNKRIFAVMKGSGVASPGILPTLLVSTDQGTTWTSYSITTFDPAEDPVAIEVVGSMIFVLSATGEVHYAPISDPSLWTEATVVFTNSNAIFSVDATKTFVVCDGGTIYVSTNPATDYTVQQSGSVTAENLTCIHGVDRLNLLVGGANGTLLFTTNGGKTWALAPATPATLGDVTTVWMRTKYVWMIGDDDGQLFYTTDAGSNWFEVDFPVTGQGAVKAIRFCDHPDSPFGFMLATGASGKGYIFRTLDGGHSWYTLPDGNAVIPDNDGLNALDVGLSANFCIAGGVDSTAGILILGL